MILRKLLSLLVMFVQGLHGLCHLRKGENLQEIELPIYPQGLSQAYVPKTTLSQSALTVNST